jgi:hypothetical protein
VLGKELGSDRGAPLACKLEAPARGAYRGMLSRADERLVDDLTAALGAIGIAYRSSHPEARLPDKLTIQATLGGVEILLRSAIVAGEEDRIAASVPTLVYFVIFPLAGHQKALGLSQRMDELLQEGKAPEAAE